MKQTIQTLLALALLAAPVPALATTQDAPLAASPVTAGQTPLELRARDVVALINGEKPPEELFTDDFLAEVPPEQFIAISQQLTSQFGAALAVEGLENPAGTRSAFAIHMERAIAKGIIGVGANGKINELLLQSFEPSDDTPAKIEADLAALPGEVSFWFGPIEGGDPVLSQMPNAQMAIGSTFKLYVLATLGREVAEGKRNWSDVVTLPDTRSFPSGMTQDWPEGAPMTLMSLANLMISISDNTATDALIDVLGRDAVLKTLIASGHADPARNDPFLKTRELFLLKAGPEDRLAAYRAGDAKARAAILAAIETPELAMDQVQEAFSGGPVALDVEWFASAADLASLFRYMRKTADPKTFEAMGINIGVTDDTRENWSYIGYKGGSEPGVLNLTWLLTDSAGRDHALVLSWNNSEAEVDLSTINLIAMRILAL